MALNSALVALLAILIAPSAIADSAPSSSSNRTAQFQQLVTKFDVMQTQIKKTFEDILNATQNQGFSKAGQTPAQRMLAKFEDTVQKYETYLNQLVPVITSKLRPDDDGDKNKQNVQKLEDSTVPAKLETATTFSFKVNSSAGETLKLCIWEHKLKNGGREVVVINPAFKGNNGGTSVAGLTYDLMGLKSGACALKIQSVAESDKGEWLCTLVATTGTVYAGSVNVVFED